MNWKNKLGILLVILGTYLTLFILFIFSITILSMLDFDLYLTLCEIVKPYMNGIAASVFLAFSFSALLIIFGFCHPNWRIWQNTLWLIGIMQILLLLIFKYVNSLSNMPFLSTLADMFPDFIIAILELFFASIWSFIFVLGSALLPLIYLILKRRIYWLDFALPVAPIIIWIVMLFLGPRPHRFLNLYEAPFIFLLSVTLIYLKAFVFDYFLTDYKRTSRVMFIAGVMFAAIIRIWNPKFPL